MSADRLLTALTRRGFLAGGATAGLWLPGCCRREGIRVKDPDIGRKDRPETLVTLVPILPDKVPELQARLESHAFEVPRPGVHFARLTIMPGERLLFTLVYDDHRRIAVDFLARNAASIDRVFSLCEGWPSEGAADRDALDKWLRKFDYEILLLYSAFSRGSEPAIRESVTLRDDFLRMVHAVTVDPKRVSSEYHAFLLANRVRMHAQEGGEGAGLKALRLTDPNEQNPFTMAFELRKGQKKRLFATLKVGEWAIEHFHIHPLREIPTVHYARFAALQGRHVLFASVYDGDWEQYVDDFAAMIPTKLDKVWGGAVGYPAKGAKDAPALAKFLDTNRIHRDYFYSALGKCTVKQIQASLALGDKLVRWSRTFPSTDRRLLQRIRAFVAEHQRLLA